MPRDGTITRNKIMDVAQQMVLQVGLTGTSVEKVIDGAGVTKGTFFYHFKTKHDLAAAMISGELWFKISETMKLVYFGKLNPWVGGKDLILYSIGDIGVDGALYRAMEFTGPVIGQLNMADRFTMANMATEAGAKNGIFEPDEITKEYIQNRVARDAIFYNVPDSCDILRCCQK